MSEKLEPLLNCPFCGNEPKVRRTVEEYPAEGEQPAGEYEVHVAICCDTCGFEVGDEYLSTATENWNRRSSLAAVPEELRVPGEVSMLREELIPERLQRAIDVEASAPPHVKADPLGWLLDVESSMGCYIITEDGKPDRINSLVSAVGVNGWRLVAQVAAVALARALAPVPQAGWRLVPEEPTEDMVDAGVIATQGPTLGDRVVTAYRAMIAAAPAKPPTGDE